MRSAWFSPFHLDPKSNIRNRDERDGGSVSEANTLILNLSEDGRASLGLLLGSTPHEVTLLFPSNFLKLPDL